MKSIVPPIPPSRAREARETFDALVQDLASTTGASPRAIRKAIRARGGSGRIKRLCLALLDHAGVSGVQRAPASRTRRRAARRSRPAARSRKGAA